MKKITNKVVKMGKVKETPNYEIPYTEYFAYFFDGNHAIIRQGKIIGHELEEKVAKSKVEKLNNYIGSGSYN